MKRIVVSIKHEYCDLIYRGYKTIELRKSMPKKDKKIFAYIYDTAEKAVTGCMEIDIAFEVLNITETICSKACVSPDFAASYKLQGKGKLYAWSIKSQAFYNNDWLTLEDIGIKRAPQSWQYLPE